MKNTPASRASCPCESGQPYSACCGRWHASTSPGELALPPLRWLGLEVRHAEQSRDAGVVEFVARCRDGARSQRLHEISRFVRETGRWYYIDGQIPDANGGVA